ncbi:MAG: hypothetical protein MUF38_00360 [Anaerolineae bacterium]|jgi:hypothetical protein|nr:hypothetical protein [Anaerolineae bacterium]
MRKSLVLAILFFGLWMGVGAHTPESLVITDLSWSTDGRYVGVGTGYWDENWRRCKSYGVPKITLIDTGRSTLRTIERTGVACQPITLSFSPDNTKLVLVADGEEVWDLETEIRIAWVGGAIFLPARDGVPYTKTYSFHQALEG